MNARVLPLLLLTLLPLACSGGQATTGSVPASPSATPLPPTTTPILPDRFFLVGETSPALQVLAGTTPKGDIYVVTTNGYVPAPGGQPCAGAGEVRVNGSMYRATRRPDGFTVSTNAQHPNTPSFRIEVEASVTAEGQATGTARITPPTCDTGPIAWTGRLVSDQEFAAVLAAFTRQDVLDLFGLSAPAAAAVDLAAVIPVTQETARTASSSAAQQPPGRPATTAGASPLPKAIPVRPAVGPLRQVVRVQGDSLPPEIQRILTFLPVPDGLTFVFSDNPSPNGGYFSNEREIRGPTRAASDKGLPAGVPRPQTFENGLAHEICHAYQHWQILADGLREPDEHVKGDFERSWYQTPEGQAFIQASLRTVISAVEDFANVCAFWYLNGPCTEPVPRGWCEVSLP